MRELKKERAILHSDANCFYASCEMVLNPENSLKEKAEGLVELANKNGGRDNISLILVHI